MKYLKIAIIGAGLAGIICTLQFEKVGIFPDVFEKQKHVAESYAHAGAALQLAVRPIKDPLVYISKTYGIQIQSYAQVKKIVHYGPSTKATVTGELGYFLARGSEPNSCERLLAKNIKSNIIFNKAVDYKELKNIYDYVIIASGNSKEGRELGVWKSLVSMWVKGAVVIGNFEEETLTVWINKDYCNSGYAYLIPFDKNRASLVLAVTDTNDKEINKYWEKFITTEKLNYEIEETFIRLHESGYVYPHKINNIYLIGNAGGALDPLLGFGIFPSTIFSSEVVKSIMEKKDFEAQIKNAVDLNMRFLQFRKTFNMLDNKKYDFLIKSIGLPGTNPLIYNSNINVVKLGSLFARGFNYIFENK